MKYSKKGLEVETFMSNKGQKFKIIEYLGCNDCTIQFEDGTIVYCKKLNEIKRGEIKNPNFPLVYDKGFVGIGKYCYKNDKKAHGTWINMLKRCYDDKYHLKRPTYKDVKVCEEWHNFQVFAKWFYENYDFKTMQGWHLDKDILINNIKVYSPDTCCFVPNEINCLFIKGKYVGVRKVNNNYVAIISISNKKKHLGTFSTFTQAQHAYNTAKKQNVREVIIKYKDTVDKRIFDRLYDYEKIQ